jgi:hypothetical protein
MRIFSKSNPVLIWNAPKREQEKLGILDKALKVVGCLSLLGLSCLYYYWCTRQPLPAPGQAVLIIGVVAALMALDIKSPLKAASIVLIFALAFLETKSINYDRFKADVRDKQLLDGTTNLVTQVGLLGPRQQQESQQLADLRNELQLSEARDNATLSARLQSQISTVQKRYEATTAEMALALAPPVIVALHNKWQQCNDGDIQRINVMQMEMDQPKRQQLQNRWNEWVNNCSQEARTFLLSANAIGEAFPKSQQDAKVTAIFAKVVAGEPVHYVQIPQVIAYLQNLTRKESSPSH